jgi:hypothetical protein
VRPRTGDEPNVADVGKEWTSVLAETAPHAIGFALVVFDARDGTLVISSNASATLAREVLTRALAAYDAGVAESVAAHQSALARSAEGKKKS